MSQHERELTQQGQMSPERSPWELQRAPEQISALLHAADRNHLDAEITRRDRDLLVRTSEGNGRAVGIFCEDCVSFHLFHWVSSVQPTQQTSSRQSAREIVSLLALQPLCGVREVEN